MQKTTTSPTNDSIAAELIAAESGCAPIAPITQRHPELELPDAYAIQQLVVSRKLADGDRVLGHKVGLTSRAMQEQLGVHQPDFGHLLASMAVADRGSVITAELVSPRVEHEIGFVLSAPLEGPGVTAGAVLAATDAVFPTIEIIDSRIADWEIGLVDTIADNASSARFVAPARLNSVRGLDLRLVAGLLEVNGTVVQHGAGAAVLGHPAEAVAWLANALAAFGGRLEAGTVVLSGALASSVPVRAGDVVRAEFDRLGAVSVRFE